MADKSVRFISTVSIAVLTSWLIVACDDSFSNEEDLVAANDADDIRDGINPEDAADDAVVPDSETIEPCNNGCTTEGFATCAADGTLLTCVKDDNGCLMPELIDCASNDPGGICVDGACAVDPCFGLTLC